MNLNVKDKKAIKDSIHEVFEICKENNIAFTEIRQKYLRNNYKT